MDTVALQDRRPFAGHAPDQHRPLGGYALLTTTYAVLTGAFAAWLHRSGKPVADRVEGKDIVLVAAATHKLSRLIAKDRVTSVVRAPFTEFQGDAGPGEVEEAARGRGLRRAIGELLICPYCLGMWVSTTFTVGLVVAPRVTRWTMATFTALLGADLLQMAYAKAEEQL
jgi:Protein of unknown function (DUF1360)